MSANIPTLTAVFDWIEFTAFGISLKDTLNTILGISFEDFTPLETGRYGYQNQLKWTNGNLFVMYTPIDEGTDEISIKSSMGVHVMLTGTGCRHYESLHSTLKLLKRAYSLEKINFSRLDIAIDDFKSRLISYDRIHQSAIAGHFTSRWAKWDEITSRETSTGNFIGRTMYFGSQTSSIFCRVYDKSLERKVKGSQEVPEKWTRLEIIYRKERAKKVVDHLIKGKLSLGEVLRGTLRHYLRFLTPSTDKNKARWLSATWWEELLEGVDAIKLTARKDPKSIDEMASWVDRQIAPTMAAIVEAYEGDLAWLRSILVKGSQRLSQKHKDAINLYLSREGEQGLTV